MKKDFLMTLLERSWNGELVPGQFKEKLGWHVAELAGQIQDIKANISPAAMEQKRIDLTGQAIIETICKSAMAPLIEERDVCIGRLIVDKAFEVNQVNAQLAVALFALANL